MDGDLLSFFGLIFISIIFIYVAPALALLPRWISNSDTIFAVPLLSIGIVYGIGKVFFTLGIWSPQLVRITLGLIFFVALVRSKEWVGKQNKDKRDVDWKFVAVVAILLLPILAELATAPFDSDDENTSWNYWAKLAFAGQSPDLFYTRAPYPQLLTLLLSSNYALLGDWSYQLPVKAGLWMISLSCFGLLATFTAKKLGRVAAIVVLLIVVYFVDLRGEFRVAYADPLMTSFLLAGFYFLYNGREGRSNESNLWFAGLFLSLCAVTKQAGLPWAIVFFPVVYAATQAHNSRGLQYWAPLLMPIFAGGVWLITEGHGALSNEGVLRASLGERGVVEQLLGALMEYGRRPELLITYLIFTLSVCWKPSLQKFLIALSLLISTGLWLTYGGYQYRLGIHNFLIAWFFIVLYFSEGMSTRFEMPKRKSLDRILKVSLSALLISSFVYSGLAANKKLRGTASFSLLDGLSRQAWSFFGYEGEEWLSELKATDNVKVLVFSNYINGMLAPEIEVARMEKTGSTENPVELSKYIINERVSHLIIIGNPMYRWGLGNVGLESIVSLCPEKYRLISEAKGNKIGLFIDFRAKLYRVTESIC